MNENLKKQAEQQAAQEANAEMSREDIDRAIQESVEELLARGNSAKPETVNNRIQDNPKIDRVLRKAKIDLIWKEAEDRTIDMLGPRPEVANPAHSIMLSFGIWVVFIFVFAVFGQMDISTTIPFQIAIPVIGFLHYAISASPRKKWNRMLYAEVEIGKNEENNQAEGNRYD